MVNLKTRAEEKVSVATGGMINYMDSKAFLLAGEASRRARRKYYMQSMACSDGEADVKKGPWTPEEDKLLVDYIGAHGHGSWHRLPRLAGLNRSGKSCRERWTNHLRPDIKHVRFTDDEEKLLISLHSTLGNKWSEITTHMPGRTDNEIKNYWFTHLRKKLPDPQHPLIDGLRDIYRHSLVEASSSLPTSVGPENPPPQSWPNPDQFLDISTMASFDLGAGDTHTDGLRNFYRHAIVEFCLPNSFGPSSSSSIQADPAQLLDFSTSFDFDPGSSSSVPADPARFLDFSTSFDFGSAGLDCSTYFDFDSGNTHTDLLSDVNPHGLLEGLDNFYFDPYPGAGSSSLSIKADPAQPPSSSSTTSGIVLDELTFFDDSVSSSSGAMRPLVGKLGMLLEGSVSISKRVKNGVCLLKDDVEEIGSYLDELSGLEDAPPMAKCWMNEVRDLSYDIEDYIDSTLFRQPDHLNKNKKKKNKKFTSNVKIPKIRLKCCNCKQTKSKYVKTIWVCRNIRHIIINNRLSKRPRNIGAPEMISDFRKYLQEAIERHDRYKLHCCSTLRRRFLSTGRMLPTPFEEASQIVIDGRTNEFINSLASNAAYQQQLNVVSVLGSGCLGKTTLAYVLYNRIGMQFDCRAFIRVPKNPDMKRLFRDLFSQLHHKKQPLPTSCNELGISDNIRNYLQDKRYLIIIDDLCDASVWDIIKYAFPKGNRGSRIITTTQIEDVALTCCCDNSEHVFEMKPLDDDHSRKLIFGRLFGKERGCPEEFKQVSDEIVDMCGGLPLAIINIASHIANQQKAVSMDLLIYIRDSLRSDLWSNSTSERTRQVLNLSYNNLPDCLKTCLLYFGMYPEGSIISKDDLLKQWVAEGFTARERKEHDQDMMENAAGNYFRELIDRSFIQPIYTDYNNKVLSCMVHDMVHDLIIQKSAEENFIVLVDYNRKNIALSHKVRRLSLHFGEARYAKTPANIRKSQVRSLGFFGLLECMPCIREFKVLHVLNLQLSGHPGDHDLLDLTGISELLQLRYLKIAGDVCIQLPNRIRGLQCLETLDIMGATRLTAVPWDIIHLPHLLHLTLPVDTKLLSWIGSMSDSIVSLWSLGKLKYLQDLHLTNSSTHLSYYLERSMEALCSLFEGHGNLKTIVVAHGSLAKNIVYGDSNVIIPWDHMAPPPLLQRFECSPDSCIIFFRIPPWVRNLHSLSILKIAVMGLHLSCLDILGSLPALTALSLYLRRAPTYKISFDNAGFSALKYFKLRIRSGIAWLKFGADAMPDLWKLKLVFNDIPEMDYQRGTPVISIEHMRGLREISAKFGVAASDLEYASRNIISNHPNNPRINMQLVAYSSNVDGSTKQTQQPDDIMEEPDEYIRQEIGERPSDKRISKSGGSSSHVHIPEIRPILGVERWEHIFDKVLTLGDVGKLNRLMIPKKHAEKYFPLEALSAEVGIILSFEDCDGKPWRFRYSYWDSCQSYVMTKGWSRFVEEKRLSTGDIVSFFRGVAGGAVGRLFIDWRSEQRQEYMF